MANVVTTLKDKIMAIPASITTELKSPLDTYMTAREHTLKYVPMRNYLWKIELPDLSALNLNWSGTSSIVGNLVNNVTNVAQYGVDKLKSSIALGGNRGLPSGFAPKVCKAQIPMPGFDVTDITYQGWKYKFPTTESTGEMTLNLWADEQGFALGYYMLWHNKIKNRDGTVNYPTTYERDVPIGLYRTDGSLAVQLTAYGVFPVGMSEMPLTDGSSGTLIFNTYQTRFKIREIGINKINN